MLNADYIRNLNSNYERVLLEKVPEERKYQYGILNRGGIRYLLPCSLRYINGLAYLYYDITSLQNVEQLYSVKVIDREWMKSFLWSMQQIRLELGRYLLDERCINWHPKHIYQDLDKHDFSFLYVPYYEGESEFDRLMDFWLEHMDYSDDNLVNFVYRACEQYKRIGEEYLQKRFFDDFDAICSKEVEFIKKEKEVVTPTLIENNEKEIPQNTSLRLLWDGKRKREERKALYRMQIRQRVEGLAVCEEQHYQDSVVQDKREELDYGKTIYLEEQHKEKITGLYYTNGELLVEFTKYPFLVGKKREEVQFAFSDPSVSRMHARFTKKEDGIYVEDVNSTNGTFKNGLRLQPYEKRRLEDGDELRFGAVECIFRGEEWGCQ